MSTGIAETTGKRRKSNLSKNKNDKIVKDYNHVSMMSHQTNQSNMNHNNFNSSKKEKTDLIRS